VIQPSEIGTAPSPTSIITIATIVWHVLSIEEREAADEKGPGIVVHPPLLFFTTLVGGLVLHFLFPLRFVSSLPVQLGIGLPLIAVGSGLGVWASKALLKAGTGLDPHSPVRSVVIHGPFSFSRNPIYLSGVIILLGVAVAVDTLWLILLVPFGFVLIFSADQTRRGISRSKVRRRIQKLQEQSTAMAVSLSRPFKDIATAGSITSEGS